jgi:hypothetical protein
MPGFDGNGPMGAGSMTGGARGYCIHNDTGYEGPAFRPAGFRGRKRVGNFGRRFGRRRGFGRFWGRGFGPYSPEKSLTAEEELNLLKQQADAVKATLDTIHKRISEIESDFN